MKTCSWMIGVMALPFTLVALQGVNAQPDLGAPPKGENPLSKVGKEGGREAGKEFRPKESTGRERPEGKNRIEDGDRIEGVDRPEGKNRVEGREGVRKEGGGKDGQERQAFEREDMARLEAIAGKPLTDEQKQKLSAIDTARRAAAQNAAQTARTEYQQKAAAVMGFPPAEWNTRLQAAQNQPKGERAGERNEKTRATAWFEAMAGRPLTEAQQQQLREAMTQSGEATQVATREAMLPFRAQTAAVLGLTPEEFDARERAWQVKQNLEKSSREEIVRFEALNGKPLTEEQKVKLLEALFQRNLAAAEYLAAQVAFRRTSAATLGLTPAEIEAKMQKLAAERKGIGEKR